MQSNKVLNDFAKQLMAWSAIMILFLQPLGLNGNKCGCEASARQVAEAPCCCSADVSSNECFGAAKSSCCSASKDLPGTRCKCGDQCRCSVNEPGKQLPAVPINESQNERTQTLATTIRVEPVFVLKIKSKFRCQSFSVYRPALTAQQTCVLLSRFIV